jgi:hypothetical protein
VVVWDVEVPEWCHNKDVGFEEVGWDGRSVELGWDGRFVELGLVGRFVGLGLVGTWTAPLVFGFVALRWCNTLRNWGYNSVKETTIKKFI